MATINIGGNNQDRFYRYKMPKLISKIEGKGNGIKTVVPNMSDIARSLSRPPTYPTKFFGCELGAQVKCDEKNDRYIVNGAHEAAKLQELLDVFIKKYVLCAGCNNPETDLIIIGKNNSQKIIRDCKACGQRTDVDMRHKLVTYILKYPPSPPKSKSGKTKKKKGEDDEQASPTSKGSSEEGTDDELTRRIEAEAANLPTADQYKDDDDWALDTSAEAVAKRTKEFSKLLLDESDSDEDGDPYEQLDKWLEENATSASSNDIYKKIKELGVSKEVDQVLKHLVLGLFAKSFQGNMSNINKHIHKKAKLLQKFVQNPDGQRALLGATEVLVSEHKDLFESKIICNILMGYYQNDLLEEEVFQAWIEGVSSVDYQNLFKKTASVNYVDVAINQDIRNKAKPFAKWLEEAEEDDDEDDD